MKNNDQTQKIFIGIAGAFLGYQFIIKPILEKLNLKDTAAEVEDKKTTENYGGGGGKTIESNPWNPNFIKILSQSLKQGQQLLLLKVATLNSLALTIYDAKASFNSSLPFFQDNEEAVYGALRQITAQTQLSQLATVFNQKYERDLYEYIKGFMNTEEIATVANIVKGYKKGIITNGKLI